MLTVGGPGPRLASGDTEMSQLQSLSGGETDTQMVGGGTVILRNKGAVGTQVWNGCLER